jgi:hypothetical protein
MRARSNDEEDAMKLARQTPELRQFLGAVTQEETHHTRRVPEPESRALGGVEISHE